MSVVLVPAHLTGLTALACRMLLERYERAGRPAPAGYPQFVDQLAEVADTCGHDVVLVVGDAHTRLVTYPEAARLLGCSTRTIGRMVAAGELPVVRRNARVVRVPLDAVLDLMEGTR